MEVETVLVEKTALRVKFKSLRREFAKGDGRMMAKPLNENFDVKMSRGVPLEDFTTKPCKVKLDDEKDDAFKITLTEGKKHQIRRMCTYFDYEVRSLKRIRILNIKLGNLRPGEFREILGTDLVKFLKEVGMR